MPAGEPGILELPFRLHGHPGRVRVRYGVNDDPGITGHDLIAVGYDEHSFRGFPVIEATVDTDGDGYRALCGWVQLVTTTDRVTGESHVDVDQLPFAAELDSPLCYFGHRPTLFDAPANPDRPDGRWLAESFLVSVGVRDCAVVPLVAVAWGYDLAAGRPTPLPVRPLGLDRWDHHVPLLAERYPRWTFGTVSDPRPVRR